MHMMICCRIAIVANCSCCPIFDTVVLLYLNYDPATIHVANDVVEGNLLPNLAASCEFVAELQRFNQNIFNI